MDSFAQRSKLRESLPLLFDGRAVEASLGGSGMSFYVKADSATMARRIVKSVCPKRCSGPYPGPEG
jgi:hypothetical protein